MTNKGFTLLELLMVIIVVGIVASFAVPEYFFNTRQGVDD